MGSWKRADGTPLDTRSDGYATGLATLALELATTQCRASLQACAGAAEAPPDIASTVVTRGLSWLAAHQDPATGAWFASSLNKKRDPASDAGQFMNDAATAYAVLALTKARQY